MPGPSIVLVLALTLSIAPSPSPQQREAQAAWDRADAHAAAGNHDDAVNEYARAWQDLDAPAILYSWAQSERLRGHCTEAGALYDRFVDEGQTPPASYDTELLRAQWSNMLANAERQREACRADTTTQADPVPAPVPTAAAPPSATTPSATTPSATPTSATTGNATPTDATPAGPRSPRPWWRDAAGWSLAGTGAAALVAGAVLVVVADAQNRGADGLGSHGAFDDAIDRAIVEQRAGFGLLGVGGALVLGGILRFAVVARRSGRAARPVALDLGPRGLSLRGRF
jgi:hypothetical protein